MLALGEADAGKTIELAAGETIEIRLPENASAGYRWTLAPLPGCELLAEERDAPEKLVPGAPGAHLWRLKATRAGDCPLTIAYRRAWQRQAPPQRTFTITLRVRG